MIRFMKAQHMNMWLYMKYECYRPVRHIGFESDLGIEYLDMNIVHVSHGFKNEKKLPHRLGTISGYKNSGSRVEGT